ncbi:MAG: SDR family oxidoreductase [Sciscionella sp.]
MRIPDKIVVITGAGHGIGAALAIRFAAEGARAVVVSDIDGAAAEQVAAEIGKQALAVAADVSEEAQVRDLVATAERERGPIDLFCSNAGVAFGSGLDAGSEDWARAWSVNLMPHVYAARAVLPAMMARGSGYLLNTASAAGLLTSPGDAAYTASKHAAVGLAEWLALTYGSRGVGVSVLCPMGVRTDLLMKGVEAGDPAALAVAASADIIEPEAVADAVCAGLAEERFLILPHPAVGTMYAHKASDPDRWLAGMRRAFSE